MVHSGWAVVRSGGAAEPALRHTSPPTIVATTPTASLVGASYVAPSITRAGSKTTMSAHFPTYAMK
jgi:hypothetical protein